MPNPIATPGYYGKILIGGRAPPGEIVDIRIPEAPEEWVTTRPLTGTGWQQIHRGRQPVKAIEVEVSLNASDDDGVAAAYGDHYTFVVFVRGKPPPLPSKPPSLGVVHTPLKDVGVRSVVYVKHTPARFTVGKNSVVYTFDEATTFKLIPVGPPEAAVLNEFDPNPTTESGAGLRDIVASTRGAQDPREPPVTVSDLNAEYGAGQ